MTLLAFSFQPLALTSPAVTLERMRQLEQAAESDVAALAAMLAKAPGKP